MYSLTPHLARRIRLPPSTFAVCPSCARQLSRTAPVESGHSKWASMKHDKARHDASRSRQRSGLGKEISDASKLFGPDPAYNPRLADAIVTAKRAGMPKANIESAIARGQGLSNNGAALEHVTIEAVVPPVALIVECQTDSKGRTLQELRYILKERGGTATPTSYLFEKRGRCTFNAKDGVGPDEVFDVALEAGALDVTLDDQGRVVVDTEPQGRKDAETKIAESFSLDVASSESIWHPISETSVKAHEVGKEPLAQLEKLEDELHGLPEVQGVYMNVDLAAAINQLNAAEGALS